MRIYYADLLLTIVKKCINADYFSQSSRWQNAQQLGKSLAVFMELLKPRRQLFVLDGPLKT